MVVVKAALSNIFVCTTGEINICNVRGVTCGDKPTESYHQTLQFPSALQSILALSSSLLVCFFTVLVHSHCSHQPCFQPQQTAVFSEKALINPLSTTRPASNNRQSQQLAGEHSGALSSQRDIFLESWWRPKQSYKQSEH